MLVIEIFGDTVMSPGSASESVGRSQTVVEAAACAAGTYLIDDKSGNAQLVAYIFDMFL